MKTYKPDICNILERKALEEQSFAEGCEGSNVLTSIAKAECIALRRAASIIQESNSILRSFSKIAKRSGEQTAWPELKRIIDKELKRQNAKMPKILR